MMISFAYIWIPVKFWLREKLLAKKKKYVELISHDKILLYMLSLAYLFSTS